VQIELVAYGPGLNMFRDDTSPVKDRLKQISALGFPSRIKFSACNITKEWMEKREGHPIAIVPEASLGPSGAFRLLELQERGWSYLKPLPGRNEKILWLPGCAGEGAGLRRQEGGVVSGISNEDSAQTDEPCYAAQT